MHEQDCTNSLSKVSDLQGESSLLSFKLLAIDFAFSQLGEQHWINCVSKVTVSGGKMRGEISHLLRTLVNNG